MDQFLKVFFSLTLMILSITFMCLPSNFCGKKLPSCHLMLCETDKTWQRTNV